MIPHSEEFKKALLSPIKQMHIKIEIYDAFDNLIGDITKKVTKNDIGSISIDISRPIRRSFSFSLDNSNGGFTWSEDNLVWLDKKVRVFVGLKLHDGSIEYLPQGVFILTEISDSHTRDSTVTSISGQDAMYNFVDKRGKFTTEMTIETGVNVATAIKLIAQSNGETKFLFDEVNDTVPYQLTYSMNQNKWDALNELANFAKAQIFFDINGYMRLKKVESLNQLQNESAVWSFKVGDRFYAGNVRKLDESQTYNDFIALGGGSETEVVSHRLTVTESNPIFADSPYSIEKLGFLTYIHNEGNLDPLLVTTEDCLYRNKFSLMNMLGYSEKVSCNIAPMFILDVNDIVEIEDDVNGVTGRYMIEKFDIPLQPQVITMECAKERKVVENWDFL
jgi:hypothetical protein